MKVFIQSYEDSTFVGREVENMEIFKDAELPTPLTFHDVVEILKKDGKGDFIFYESYDALAEAEDPEKVLIIDKT